MCEKWKRTLTNLYGVRVTEAGLHFKHYALHLLLKGFQMSIKKFLLFQILLHTGQQLTKNSGFII